jgi:hypothetical protein
MKSEQKRKELEELFKQKNMFSGSVFFTLVPLIRYLQGSSSIYLLITSIIFILVTLLISIWSYQNRVKALAYLVGSQMRFSMLLCVCVIFMITMVPPRLTYVWLSLTFGTIILAIIYGGIVEYRNWGKKIELWENYKKIDILQGHFDILVTPPTIMGKGHFNYKKKLWLGLFCSIVVIISMRMFNALDPNLSRFIVFLAAFYLSAFISVFWCMGIGTVIEFAYLQKKHQIIFTTEYRDLK